MPIGHADLGESCIFIDCNGGKSCRILDITCRCSIPPNWPLHKKDGHPGVSVSAIPNLAPQPNLRSLTRQETNDIRETGPQANVRRLVLVWSTSGAGCDAGAHGPCLQVVYRCASRDESRPCLVTPAVHAVLAAESVLYYTMRMVGACCMGWLRCG